MRGSGFTGDIAHGLDSRLSCQNGWVMRVFNSRLIVAVLILLFFCGTAAAKSYKAINEIPGQVPAAVEEEGVWLLVMA